LIQTNRTNRKHPDIGLLSECKSAIQQAAPGADVILFGSRARGDAQEDSDYDLLILIDSEHNVAVDRSIVEQLFPLEMRTGKVLTFFVYQRDQWNSPLFQAMPFHKNITKEGMVI
jgi:predicted nucleotidyltransferase